MIKEGSVLSCLHSSKIILCHVNHALQERAVRRKWETPNCFLLSFSQEFPWRLKLKKMIWILELVVNQKATEYPRNSLAHITILGPPQPCPKCGSVLEFMTFQSAITQTRRSDIFFSPLKSLEVFLPQVSPYLTLQLLQCELSPNHLRL